ncbi:hypothetical protein [Candidatus Binatus sp.]|uniref:hypothetical protein n=1 Tax=Candidatus Binatus sp. TaxID=2811406 RepID=UPI003CC5BFEB
MTTNSNGTTPVGGFSTGTTGSPRIIPSGLKTTPGLAVRSVIPTDSTDGTTATADQIVWVP